MLNCADAARQVNIGSRNRPMCRHCGLKPTCRPKGLCWTCYYSRIRDLYPTESVHGRRGVIDSPGRFAIPEQATDALPGSREKLRILAARAAARVSLWHPQDPVQEFVTGAVEWNVPRYAGFREDDRSTEVRTLMAM